MPFVWRDAPENEDLCWVTRAFAEAVASGDLEDAASWADLATEVAAGGYVLVRRPDGGCRAMTRQARYCHNSVAPGDELCSQHHRLIHQREDA
jgi:hypothetical protein